MTKRQRVHLRPGIRRDYPEILKIERRSFLSPWTENDFLRATAADDVRLLVAEEPVFGYDYCPLRGYVLYRIGPACLRILDLAVDPPYRRKGVGGQLLCKVAQKLHTHGLRRIVLDVPEGNLVAQVFLRSQGFRAVLPVLRGYFSDGQEDGYRFVYRLDWEQGVERAEMRVGTQEM